MTISKMKDINQKILKIVERNKQEERIMNRATTRFKVLVACSILAAFMINGSRITVTATEQAETVTESITPEEHAETGADATDDSNDVEATNSVEATTDDDAVSTSSDDNNASESEADSESSEEKSEEENVSEDNTVENKKDTRLKSENSTVAIIEIENYSVEGGILEAGREYVLNLDIYNNSQSSGVKNVMMTLSSGNGHIHPAYGNSNQVFIGALAAGETKTISVPFRMSSNFSGDGVDLNCTFNYLNEQGVASNTVVLNIPTSAGTLLGVKSVDVSTYSTLNGKTLVNIQLVNNSNITITDAIIEIEGNVSESSKRIKLDDINPRESYSKDCEISLTEAGSQEISAKLIYSDSNNEKIVNELGNFTVKVEEEVISNNNNAGLSNILDPLGKIISLAALIAVGIIVYSYIKKRFF